MRLLIVGEGSVSDLVRSFEAFEYFSKLDTLGNEKIEAILQHLPPHGGDIDLYPDIDVVVASRPMWPPLIKAYQDKGAVVIVDQDDDFIAIPRSHVAYRSIGPGNPERSLDHRVALTMADLLIVSTDELKQRFVERRYQPAEAITIIPNAWANTNPKWEECPPKPKDTIVIGWGGTITHREDFKIVLPALEAVAWPKMDTEIHIFGDPEIYKMLRGIHEYAKLFCPMVDYNVYPLVLKSCDIWLAPLVDDHFNRSKSDIKLVEAGAARIPWIASSVPQYKAWGHGGILADSQVAWQEALTLLVKDPLLREALGASGRTHAEARKFDNLIPRWIEMVEKAYELRQDANTLLLRRQQNRMELQRMADEGANASNQPDRGTPGQDDLHKRASRRRKRKRR